MKFTKKLLSLLLAIVMLFSITAGIDLSAYATVSGDFEYEELKDGTIEIIYYSDSALMLDIPETIDGKTVTSIGEGAFFYCKRLTNVTIPNSVVNIGESAFSGCERLATVVIPNSVVNIGESAFADCEKLTTVTIGSGASKIADDAFFGCEKLASINVDPGNANYSSENGVLYNKSKTELMQYPCGKADDSYTIPNTVTNIGEGAFVYSANLKSVIIPDSVTSIGDGAFAGCGLTSVAISNSVTSIGEAAFLMCENLKSASIGANVTNLGEGAFFYCVGLASITVDSANKKYSSADGVLYNKNKTELLQYPSGKASVSFTIPSSVKTIAEGSFFYCEKLASITIPKSVTSISEGEFFLCENLKSVTIYNQSIKIGEMAFPDTAVIKGYKGSTAEKYAKANDNKFTALKCSHKYKTTTVKATTKTNGTITKKCSVCGETTKTTLYSPKTITLSTSYTYDGKAKKPTVTVKDSKGKKIAASNYTVKYSNNKNVGKATVTVTFKGNYSGTLKKTFTIKPKATTLSKVTAGKKKFTAKWKKQATQTSGYELQYSTSSKFSGAKTVTVGKNTTSKTVSKLTAKKNYYVRVRTYKTVGKTKIYSAWSKSKVVTTKK